MRSASEERLLELGYALSKQIGAVHSIETDYGQFELDAAMRVAVRNALDPIIRNQIFKLKQAKP